MAYSRLNLLATAAARHHEPSLMFFKEECQRRFGVLPRTNSLSKQTRHRCSQSQDHVSNLKTHRTPPHQFVAQRQERQVNGEIFFLRLSTKAENVSSQLTFLFHQTTNYFAKATLSIPKHTTSHQHPQVHQHLSPVSNFKSTSIQVHQHHSLTNILKPNMHSLTVLSTILSLSTLSYTLPTSQPRDGPCNALIETSPWHVSSFVILSALPTAPTGSTIHFHVSDTNPGLELETSCGLTMPRGTGTRPEEAKGWHPCEDDRVRFLYQAGHDVVPGNLQLRRSYVDDWYVI